MPIPKSAQDVASVITSAKRSHRIAEKEHGSPAKPNTDSEETTTSQQNSPAKTATRIAQLSSPAKKPADAAADVVVEVRTTEENETSPTKAPSREGTSCHFRTSCLALSCLVLLASVLLVKGNFLPPFSHSEIAKVKKKR
jgi:hypothetical protein